MSEKDNKVMHWADQAARRIIAEKGEKELYTVAAGITPSGVVHLGNFREIITADLVRRALADAGKNVRFIYSWDNYDVFRKVPVNMPDQDLLAKYLRMPITEVPDTMACKHNSYAEHNEKEAEEPLPIVDIHPEFLRQAVKYQNCAYAGQIRTAMKHRGIIKEILDKYREEPLEYGWYPASIFCEKCKKDTTDITSYDEEYMISYNCECGFANTFDIRKKGIIKLLWRVDWPMRWSYEDVDFESGGKDHFAAGGSYDTAKQIVKLFDHTAPTSIRYEWIGIKGGKQLHSSTGNVVTLKQALEIYEPAIVRFLFAGTRPEAEFAVSFDLDVLKIYEDFDKCERIYFKQDEASEKDYLKQKRIYELSAVKLPKKMPYQPSFRHLTSVLQIHENDVKKATEEFNAYVKTKEDKEKLNDRMNCALNWIKFYAPDEFKFSIQKDANGVELDDRQKKALHMTAEILDKNLDDTALHEEFYRICKELNLETMDFFKAAYMVLIRKQKGPRLASFILTIGKEKVKELFEKV